jgi:alpha-beta hydrolase superfamily lysophospholipase
MHRLLVNAGVEGPYVLVGHSFGGLIARRRLLRLVLRGHLFTYRSQSGAGGMVPAVAPG